MRTSSIYFYPHWTPVIASSPVDVKAWTCTGITWSLSLSCQRSLQSSICVCLRTTSAVWLSWSCWNTHRCTHSHSDITPVSSWRTTAHGKRGGKEKELVIYLTCFDAVTLIPQFCIITIKCVILCWLSLPCSSRKGLSRCTSSVNLDLDLLQARSLH